MASRGTCSTVTSASTTYSRCSGVSAGASAYPQFAITTVDTPYCEHGVRNGSQNWLASRCVWVSIQPGASTRPRPSISSAPAPETSPTITIRSPSTATSASKPAAPVPSITVAPRTTRSCVLTGGSCAEGAGDDHARADAPVDHEVGTGDEAALVGREEQRGVGDVAHAAAATDGEVLAVASARFHHCVEIEVGWQRVGDHLHVPRRGADGVHADVERTELEGGRLGEAAHRELAPRVRSRSRRREHAVDRR